MIIRTFTEPYLGTQLIVTCTSLEEVHYECWINLTLTFSRFIDPMRNFHIPLRNRAMCLAMKNDSDWDEADSFRIIKNLTKLKLDMR